MLSIDGFREGSEEGGSFTRGIFMICKATNYHRRMNKIKKELCPQGVADQKAEKARTI